MAEDSGSRDHLRRIVAGAKNRLFGRFASKEEPASVTEGASSTLPDYLAERPDISNYSYLRKAFHELQTGTKGVQGNFEPVLLPGTTPEFSSWVGHSGAVIGDHMLVGLREGRVDENGKPYILCTDEISDSQVLKNASVADRVGFFERTLKTTPKSTILWLADETRAGAFALSSVAMGTLLLNLQPQQSREFVSRMVEQSEGSLDTKERIKTTLDSLNPDTLKSLLDYLSTSPQRLITETRNYRSKNGAEEFRELGDGPIVIDDKEYNIQGVGQVWAEIPTGEEKLIQPFYRALHESRESMIQTARLFASTYLGASEELAARQEPPSWFRKADNGEGIRGDEVLLFIPREDPDKFSRLPNFITQLQEAGMDQSGWYKFKIKRGEDKSQIVGATRLTS